MHELCIELKLKQPTMITVVNDELNERIGKTLASLACCAPKTRKAFFSSFCLVVGPADIRIAYISLPSPEWPSSDIVTFLGLSAAKCSMYSLTSVKEWYALWNVVFVREVRFHGSKPIPRSGGMRCIFIFHWQAMQCNEMINIQVGRFSLRLRSHPKLPRRTTKLDSRLVTVNGRQDIVR